VNFALPLTSARSIDSGEVTIIKESGTHAKQPRKQRKVLSLNRKDDFTPFDTVTGYYPFAPQID